MTLLTTLQSITNKISVALITIFIGFIIAKIASRVATRVMREAELNRILKTAGLKPFSDTLGNIIEYLIYTITVLIVLQQFGLTKLVIGILILFAAIFIAFTLLLTLRDFVPNALTGLFIRTKLKKHLGKKVKIGPVTGKLNYVGIVSSIITNKEEHHIPHVYASKQKITRLRVN